MPGTAICKLHCLRCTVLRCTALHGVLLIHMRPHWDYADWVGSGVWLVGWLVGSMTERGNAMPLLAHPALPSPAQPYPASPPYLCDRVAHSNDIIVLEHVHIVSKCTWLVARPKRLYRPGDDQRTSIPLRIQGREKNVFYSTHSISGFSPMNQKISPHVREAWQRDIRECMQDCHMLLIADGYRLCGCLVTLSPTGRQLVR